MKIDLDNAKLLFDIIQNGPNDRANLEYIMDCLVERGQNFNYSELQYYFDFFMRTNIIASSNNGRPICHLGGNLYSSDPTARIYLTEQGQKFFRYLQNEGFCKKISDVLADFDFDTMIKKIPANILGLLSDRKKK